MPLSGDVAIATAALVRSPLLWSDAEECARDPAEVASRGWFRGARECARHLASLTGAPTSTAWAFGEKWPVVAAAEWLVAPGMPLVLSPGAGVGPDGTYTRRGSTVYREAAGRETVFLTTCAAERRPGRPFDLLWFGENDRFIVREGTLEVEDLFAHLELPAERGLLERILVRGRGVNGHIFDGMTIEPSNVPATITVHRSAALHLDERWREPENFFRARAEVERTERHPGEIVVHVTTGSRTLFRYQKQSDGWSAALEGGDSLMVGFSMRQRGESLSLKATIHPSVDLLAPSVRGRLAFDLRSDLVALS